MKGLGWLLAFFIAIIAVSAFTLGFSVRDAFGDSHDLDDQQITGETRVIFAKALTDYDECDDSEWHFIINQINEEGNAPPWMRIFWSNDAAQTIPLYKFEGGTAHYTTDSNLGSSVTRALVRIYAEWSTGGPYGNGQFNLSHGPCTPTPCEDDEERLEDDTCQEVYPPEEFPPKPEPKRDHTLYPPPPTPDATPTPTLTLAATSAFQAPAAFPDTGGEPAEKECRDWTTGQAGDSSTPCPASDNLAGTMKTVGILLVFIGLASLAFWALFRRG